MIINILVGKHGESRRYTYLYLLISDIDFFRLVC